MCAFLTNCSMFAFKKKLRKNISCFKNDPRKSCRPSQEYLGEMRFCKHLLNGLVKCIESCFKKNNPGGRSKQPKKKKRRYSTVSPALAKFSPDLNSVQGDEMSSRGRVQLVEQGSTSMLHNPT